VSDRVKVLSIQRITEEDGETYPDWIDMSEYKARKFVGFHVTLLKGDKRLKLSMPVEYMALDAPESLVKIEALKWVKRNRGITIFK
jgi:hypothetical protein